MASKRNEYDEPIYDVSAYYVRKTNDYGKFKFIDGNRDVDKTASLKKSIKENGWYRQPILVNKRFEIIEGQHRFVVCKELRLPIEYIVQEGLKAKDCAPLNVGRRNWAIKDYVHLGAVSSDAYRYFEYLLQRFGFSPAVTYVATGRSLTGGGMNHVIRSGFLTCTPEEYDMASSTLEWLSQFKEDVKAADLRGSKDALYLGLIFARRSKQVSTDALTDRVHRNFSRYGRAVADITDAIEKTEKIYNYKCKVENTADLVSEYRKAVRREKEDASKDKGK